MPKSVRFLCIAAAALWLAAFSLAVTAQDQPPPPRLFGTKEERKEGFGMFPQWVSVMRRHENERGTTEWQQYLASLRGRGLREQITGVNEFANRFRYVLDQDNYGKSDYWAIPREFLQLGGDCEDYAIIKYFSLRQLGFPAENLRIVVVQDTNLRIPHAILAVYLGNDILILDNQVAEIVSHRNVAHYAPVFSLNERNWWMHLP